MKRPARFDAIVSVLALLAATLILHGMALWDGVTLDDHWHQKGLREHGWSFSELLRTLDISPQDFLHCWWQTRFFSWDYLRPLFILCMKFVYIVIGNKDAAALHAFSLLLHFASVLMVWRLCLKLTRAPFWSLLGGIVFAVYQHSSITVAWPSSQNVVLQTTLLLAALLAYIRASRLNVGPEEAERAIDAGREVPRVAAGWLVLALVCWLLAIFSRENALLIPAIFASFDLAFGGRRYVRARWGVYALMLAVGVVFVAWREWMHVSPLPDVYARRPAGDAVEYAGWLLAKLLHYLATSVWPAPMSIGPTGRYNPWATSPGDCLLMIGILAAVGWGYWRSARTARGWWIWPLWILIAVLPVVAVIATPHSGYMSGVGLAVAVAVAPEFAARGESRRTRRWAAGATILMALGMAFMGAVNRLQWMASAAADRYVPAWVLADAPLAPVQDVFFINLPFANVYCKPALVEQLGPAFERVRVHALTFSPQIVQMQHRSVVEQIDDHSFSVAVEGQAYFSRLMGRFLLEAFRGRELFQAGQVIRGEAFDVEILQADERGVWKLRFTFPLPLDDPSYCFYLTTPDCGAARLRFRTISAESAGTTPPSAVERGPIASSEALDLLAARLRGGDATAAIPLFDAALTADAPFRTQAAAALRPVCAWMGAALGSPLQGLFDQPELSHDDWRRVRDWWVQCVDNRALAGTWLRRNDFDHLIWLRAEFEWERWLVGRVLRTDLYLTGEPWDNPRGR